MDLYKPPSRRKIAEQLERAGADVNGQISGAVWISLALQGIGITKLAADDFDRLRKAKNMLAKALTDLSVVGAPFTTDLPMDFPMHEEQEELPQGWLNAEVIEPVARAAWHLDACIALYRPANSPKHSQFWEALLRYFKAEELEVTFGESSPIVMIFAECIGLDQESAYKSIQRFRRGQRSNK
ncbi:hypothetical protein [Stenotrophomonas sp. Iso1]|uniref:hypothetical protein n=1 Tax=Stenotrophomonas sp. Iso1 TaxID=2977283 RepID=UPI0022B79139|nr:hypothetical protein [Stenotrophomonas sp. Iso1]